MRKDIGKLTGIILSATISQLAFSSLPVQAGQLSKTNLISDLHIFGDSLVDDHNLYVRTGGMYPPSAMGYFEGRFSNGKVFVESLPQELKANGYGRRTLQYSSQNNYAVAGAETDNHALLGPQFSLDGQIDKFLATSPSNSAMVATSSSTATVDPDALYLIAAGANDYLAKFLKGELSIDIIEAYIKEVVGNIKDSITQLAQAGATNFMVIGLADFTIAPSFSNLGEVEKGFLQYISMQHNLTLQDSLQALEEQGLNITYLDLNSILTNSIPNFTNVTDACLNMATASICTDPDRYLWYDGSHVTAKAHKILAQQTVEFYREQNGQAASTIPEPHTILGLLAVAGLSQLLKQKTNADDD